MKVTAYDNASGFLLAAGSWLEAKESTNNLILGLAARLANAPQAIKSPPVMMTVEGSAGLEAAALMTPPRAVVLYAPGEEPLPAMEALADALLAGRYPVPGCIGPVKAAEAFARIWCRHSRLQPVLKMAQRIYELRQVSFPSGVCGTARQPRMEDLDLVAEWWHGFAVEAMQEDDRAAARTSAEQIIASGQTLIWEDQGVSVSMATATRPTRHGVAISGVFTPPAYRRRGYATACVAAMSQRQLDAGREFCCLYTDLANPTSNSIYQRIGYVPIVDSSHYQFGPPAGASDSEEA